MKYIEVTFDITPYLPQNEDLLIAILSENDFDSFWQTNNSVKAYIPLKLFVEENIKNICNKLIDNFKVNYTFSELEEKDWNETWEKTFQHILINDKCLIRAPFHNNLPKAEFEIIIEPKMSFGTGHHSTTALMVELMLDLQLDNKNVIDMGCGTGVLSILASLKNAKNVTAIDIDEWAYKNSIENCKINNCKNINVLIGGVDIIPNLKFDIFLANINRNVLLSDMHNYFEHLSLNGELLISGFLENDIELLLNKTNEFNLFKKKMLIKNDWVAIQFCKISE